MSKRFSIASLVLGMIVFNVGLLLALASPALAHHKDGHVNGGGGSGSAVTEDNDTNDGGIPNNVPDDGDNEHPSGKDRSVEPGGSGNQGKSESNPDDSKGPMRYEGELGADRADGPGGTDLADQDGNNGCGNDDDFDDDNNGWCGKPDKDAPDEPEEPEEPCVDDMTTPTDECNPTEDDDDDDDEETLGGVITRPGGGDDVRGTRFDRPEVGPSGVAAGRQDPQTRAAVLPFTGMSAASMLALAAGLIVGGLTLARMRKHFTSTK